MPVSKGDKSTIILGFFESRKKTASWLPKLDPEHNAEATLKNTAVKEANGIMMHGKDALVSADLITAQTETLV